MDKVYGGLDPYVFISYAHRDELGVKPLINKMNSDGCRIWYDLGIQAGEEWPEFIAKRLKKSALFVAFISSAYLESANCKRELLFAQKKGKRILLVFLEKVNLPSELMTAVQVKKISYGRMGKKKTYASLLEEAGRARCIPQNGAAYSNTLTKSKEKSKGTQMANLDLEAFLIPIIYLVASVWVMDIATTHYVNGWLLILFTSLPLPISSLWLYKVYEKARLLNPGDPNGVSSRYGIKLAAMIVCFIISIIASVFFVHTTDSVILKILISIGTHALALLITGIGTIVNETNRM